MKQYKNIATGTLLTLDESDMMYRGTYMDRPVVLHPLAVEGSPMIYEAVEEQFKVGDWVVILNYSNIIFSSIKGNAIMKLGACDKITSIEGNTMCFESGMKINWEGNNNAKYPEYGNSDKYLRHATPAEIKAAQHKPASPKSWTREQLEELSITYDATDFLLIRKSDLI
jgi:hypothetical protein